MKIKLLDIVFILIYIMVFLFSSVVKADEQKIFVTTAIDNNTNYTWRHNFLVVYTDLKSSKYIRFNMPEYNAPASGRLMIPVNIGKIYQISVLWWSRDDNPLCVFEIVVNSQTNATMRLISSNTTSAVACSYLGDPRNNTAKIILFNK